MKSFVILPTIYASLLINNGVDIKAVSSQLGHCNINITADTYGHIFDEYKAGISQSLEDCLLET